MNERAHLRQFLIGPDPYRVYSDWITVRLQGGLWLSHCPSLDVHHDINRKGEKVVLLGAPIQCRGGRPSQALGEITRESLRRVTDTWANRWCVIIGDSICTDSGGLLALFYCPFAGAKVFSSSVKLLARHYPGCDERVRGVSFGPATPHQGAWQLLPGQWLNLVSGEISQPSAPLFDRVSGSVDELRAEYADLLRSGIKAIAEREKRPLAVSLSGGADSRRNMAAAQAAGVEYRAFTFRKPYWITSDADLNLPRKLGQAVGHDVQVIDTRAMKTHPEAAKAYREHTAFRDWDIPGELFYYKIRDAWSTVSPAQIDGQAYELVTSDCYKETPPFSSIDEMLAWQYESTPQSRAASKAYLEKAVGGSMTDLRDFVFLLTEMLDYGQMYQAMDQWSAVYCPANCRRMYSLAQSVPTAFRQDKGFLMSVTTTLEPRFADIPTNPPDSLLKTLVHMVRMQGPMGLTKIALRKAGQAFSKQRTYQRDEAYLAPPGPFDRLLAGGTDRLPGSAETPALPRSDGHERLKRSPGNYKAR
ncbi:hypothetical protein JI739_04265 [Ramlibacter sp. AW1]|uniref:Asparagine synthetase domain-containing protein n=1 Tax=Ramlibacter aurantiacus TaxID=2801330 RepID=A0A937D557_9BURK|nr:hypothetical protein [Ramlibacter aurantiacus]MBL0419558.1 hypothetical protein [Ramlibacter aurantiacus]